MSTLQLRNRLHARRQVCDNCHPWVLPSPLAAIRRYRGDFTSLLTGYEPRALALSRMSTTALQQLSHQWPILIMYWTLLAPRGGYIEQYYSYCVIHQDDRLATQSGMLHKFICELSACWTRQPVLSLVRMYGITISTLSHIINHRCWRVCCMRLMSV